MISRIEYAITDLIPQNLRTLYHNIKYFIPHAK